MPVVWERLTLAERRIVCELGGLVPGAALVPLANFSAAQMRQLTAGMRAVVSLGQECRFALSYGRKKQAECRT